MVELDGWPIGECSLQPVTLRRLGGQWPGLELRCIDLHLRDESAWERGIGTRAIAMLTGVAFGQGGADAIFACDVRAGDERRVHAFQQAGYEVEKRFRAPAQRKGEETVDLVRWRRPAPGAGLPVDDPALTESEVLA